MTNGVQMRVNRRNQGHQGRWTVRDHFTELDEDCLAMVTVCRHWRPFLIPYFPCNPHYPCVYPLCPLLAREGIEDCTVAWPLALRISPLSFPPTRLPTLSPLLTTEYEEGLKIAQSPWPLALRISSLSCPIHPTPSAHPGVLFFGIALLVPPSSTSRDLKIAQSPLPLALQISSLSFPTNPTPLLPLRLPFPRNCSSCATEYKTASLIASP